MVFLVRLHALMQYAVQLLYVSVVGLRFSRTLYFRKDAGYQSV